MCFAYVLPQILLTPTTQQIVYNSNKINVVYSIYTSNTNTRTNNKK